MFKKGDYVRINRYASPTNSEMCGKIRLIDEGLYLISLDKSSNWWVGESDMTLIKRFTKQLNLFEE